MAYEKGDVVLVPFPFRDKSATKVRPAVVLSSVVYNQRGDLIVAAITTHPPRVSTDYPLTGWKNANLVSPSVVRMQLATIAAHRVLYNPGQLTPADLSSLNALIRQVFDV